MSPFRRTIALSFLTALLWTAMPGNPPAGAQEAPEESRNRISANSPSQEGRFGAQVLRKRSQKVPARMFLLDAPANSLQFSPARISRMAGNNFVVTDSYSGQLWIFNLRRNLIQTIRLLGEPLAVAVDKSRRIFVGNVTDSRVDIYNRGGVFQGSLNGAVTKPGEIALAEKEGLLFVTDSAENVVKVFDLHSGIFLFRFGSQGSGPGQLDFPTGIAYEPRSKNVIVGDFMNRRLQVFDVTGVWLRTIEKTTSPPLVRPQGLDVDGDGNIYVADAFWAKVYVFDPGGNFLRDLGSYGTEQGQLRTPLDVAVAADGTVLVTDSANGRITTYSGPSPGRQP